MTLIWLILGTLLNLKSIYSIHVIAHRGASGYLPEQTNEAITMAYMMKSDLIEIDVILSKDNHLIVTHDLILDEVTNVAQMYPNKARNDSHFYVIDFTVAEIKSLRVTERVFNETHAKYPNRFPIWKSAFQLQTLNEIIELLEGLHKTYKLKDNKGNVKNVSLLIEIKRPHFHSLNNKNNLSEILLETLKKYNFIENSNLIIQSFDPYELRRIKFELKSKFKLVQLLLTNEQLDYEEERGRIDYDYWLGNEGLLNISTFAIGIAPEKSILVESTRRNRFKPSRVYAKARELGLKVFAWTYRKDSLPSFANSFNSLLDIYYDSVKIDGIITDFPADVIEYDKNRLVSSASKQIISTLFILISSLILAIGIENLK